MSYNIKEDEFVNEKQNLIFLLKNISGNLPCPECSSDATDLLNKINFNNINTKEDFKMLIINFHNHVNKKLKNETPSEQILEKYKHLDIVNVTQLWYQYFTRYGIEAHEFMEGMKRDNVRNEVYRFITNNRFAFD